MGAFFGMVAYEQGRNVKRLRVKGRIHVRTRRSSAVFNLDTVALVLSTVWLRLLFRLALAFPFPLLGVFTTAVSSWSSASANETRLADFLSFGFDDDLGFEDEASASANCGLNVTLLRACAAAVVLSN